MATNLTVNSNMALRSVTVLLFLQCFVFSTAFVADSLFGPKNGKNYPNVLCVITHCAAQSAACFANSDCSSNMKCMTGCGFTNHSCMYECMNSYENQIFDNMMKCLVDDFHCLKLEPEDPSFRCTPPQQNIQNFDMANLKGTWWIVRGLNRDFDCFNCQKSTYSPTAGSANYTLDEEYDVLKVDGTIRHRVAHQQVQQQDARNGGLLDYTNTIMGLTMYEKWQILASSIIHILTRNRKCKCGRRDGTIRHRVAHQQVQQQDASNGGVLDYTNTIMGLTMYENTMWQIIDYAGSGNYAIVYYCGHMTATWWYEGTLVYSRTPTLSQDEITAVSNSLHNSGYDINKFCAPNTVNCQV